MKIKVVKIGDRLFDPAKLSWKTKFILYPVFIKIFGLFKATILIYGK